MDLGSALAVLQISAAVAQKSLKYLSAVKHAETDVGRLTIEIGLVGKLLDDAASLCKEISGIKSSTLEQVHKAAVNCQRDLEQFVVKLTTPAQNKLSIRLNRLKLWRLAWPFSIKEVEKILTDLDRHKQNLGLVIEAISIYKLNSIETKIVKVSEDIESNSKRTEERLKEASDQLDGLKINAGKILSALTAVRSKLPTVEAATLGSFEDEGMPVCHEQTRLQLRREIQAWIQDPNGTCILWLNGMAGTGKSTISRTIAKECKSQLGASFFFKRGEGDRGNASRLITTLAAQLVKHMPELLPAVQEVIESDPAIVEKNLPEQFERLILEPLDNIVIAAPDSVVLLVIDALDECDGENRIAVIIRLLAKLSTINSVKIKILLTSRPEPFIRNGFDEVSSSAFQELVLQNATADTIQQDIQIYLRHELAKIRKKHKYLDSLWPGDEAIMVLATMAYPLFIFAATMCRFIADSRAVLPDERLNTFLDRSVRLQGDQLDQTYRPVLDRLIVGVTGVEREKVITRFKTIIGLVIIAKEPLTTTSIAELLATSVPHIQTALDELHSVLSIPEDEDKPVRILHISFRDYLLDESKKDTNPFWIEEQAMHDKTAICCLELLNRTECLKQNICDLPYPGSRVDEVSREQILQCLPAEVQYACQYWAEHLSKASYSIHDNDMVHQFLQTKFVFWLEALSFMRRVREAITALSNLQLLLSSGATTVRAFIADALRFIPLCIEAIKLAPLQLYSSALVFAPRKSLVRLQFESLICCWLTELPEVREDWDPCLITLAGMNDWIMSIAFSKDGRQLAAGGRTGSLALWDSSTGSMENQLASHPNAVIIVSFYDDVLLSACGARIRLWLASTGALLNEFVLEDDTDAMIDQVIMTPDFIVATTIFNPSILVWNQSSGNLVYNLPTRNEIRNIVVQKPLLLFNDTQGCVWTLEPVIGVLMESLNDKSRPVRSLCVYKDGLVTGTDHDLQVWNTSFDHEGLLIEGQPEPVINLSVSGQIILLSSFDNHSFKNIQTLQDCADTVPSVFGDGTLSPDGSVLVLRKPRTWIRLFDIQNNEYRYLSGHNDKVTCSTFSSDGTRVASASRDGAVKIWDLSVLHKLPTSKPSAWKSWEIKYLFLSPRGLYVVYAASSRDAFWLYDRLNRQHSPLRFEELILGIASNTFSLDETYGATGGWTGNIVIWNIATKCCFRTLKQPKDTSITSLAFHPNGQILASGDCYGSIKVWNITSRSVLVQLCAYGEAPLSLCFSNDGLQFASLGASGIAALWHIHTDEQQSAFRKGVVSEVTPEISESQELELRDDWITVGDKQLIWVPYMYRATLQDTDSAGNTIVLTNADGQMNFFTINLSILVDTIS